MNQFYKDKVIFEPTDIPGLKHIPRIIGHDSGMDVITELTPGHILKNVSGNGQFSINNGYILSAIIQSRIDPALFVEIGTASNFEMSSTHIFLSRKKKETQFITIDCNERAIPDIYKEHCETVTALSTSQAVAEKLEGKKIDVLLIDGNHSIETVFDEYKFYMPYMKPGGVILLHDTTFHPGPALLLEALDDEMFIWENTGLDDYGLGVIYLR